MRQYEYPSIDRVPRNVAVYAFDKLDGSNVRALWRRKKGFVRFGSRTESMDETHTTLGEAVKLMREFHEERINKALEDMRVEEACCYFEFFGANSFAGVHQPETHHCVLIDVKLYKQGLMQPNEFHRTFESIVPTAPLLYQGNCNEAFVDSVLDRTLEGMTFEGVVCKTTRAKMSHPVEMFKIKSRDWIARVKSLYTDAKKLKELL